LVKVAYIYRSTGQCHCLAGLGRGGGAHAIHTAHHQVGSREVMADSFVVFGFSLEYETSKLGDVVSTEGIEGNLYIEGETDTYIFRLFFRAFAEASLPPAESRARVLEISERLWAEYVQTLE
jgi:hypothetical protein